MVRAKKVAVDDVDGGTLKLMKGEEKGARWRRRKKESSVAWRRETGQVPELPPSGRACGSDLGTCRAARTNGCVRFFPPKKGLRERSAPHSSVTHNDF